MQEPFSYIVQYGSFGTVDQIWDADGKLVAEIAKRPLRTSGADDPLGVARCLSHRSDRLRQRRRSASRSGSRLRSALH